MQLEQTSLIAVIMGIAQMLKTFGVSSKYIPAINMGLGLLCGFFLTPFGIESIFKGLVLGASACGVYDFGTKTIVQMSTGTQELSPVQEEVQSEIQEISQEKQENKSFL